MLFSNATIRRYLFVLLPVLLAGSALGQSLAETHALHVAGVKIKVTDMDRAVQFYRDLLGFAVDADAQASGAVVLQTNTWPIFLERTDHPAPTGYPRAAQTSLTLQTADLKATMQTLKGHGVVFSPDPPTPYGINQDGVPLGYSTRLVDPFGNTLSMVEQQRQRGEAFTGIRVYNAGFYVADVEEARALYSHVLGFPEMTEAYYPNIPLLHPDGSFGFMLHGKRAEAAQMQPAQARYPTDAQLVLVFSTPDLPATLKALKQAGVDLLHTEVQQTTAGRRFVAFKGTSGIVSEVYAGVSGN